jgi:CelD/BcsL family acetyltransferase involved in cellulose biosynthesis
MRAGIKNGMGPNAIITDVIDHGRAFARLQDEWNELLSASSADCPFLTWEWLHTWWTHLGSHRRLRLFAVRFGNELVALAPLSAPRHPISRLSPLTFLGTGFAGSDYLDFIVRRGFETESVEALTRAFRSRGAAIRLDHLPANSVAAVCAVRLAENEWSARQAQTAVCPFARLTPPAWNSYLETLTPCHQTRFRRYSNRLAKHFDLQFGEVTTESGRHAALTALFSFHRGRWGSRGTAFHTRALRAFHDEITCRALQGGWLRLYTLRLDGVLAAVTYCFSYRRRFYLYQHGFNETYRHYSVGLVALGFTIRAAVAEAATEFDMLYGCEPYKLLWARELRTLERLELFPPGIAGRLQRWSADTRHTIRTLARRTLSGQASDPCIPRAGAVS